MASDLVRLKDGTTVLRKSFAYQHTGSGMVYRYTPELRKNFQVLRPITEAQFEAAKAKRPWKKIADTHRAQERDAAELGLADEEGQEIPVASMADIVDDADVPADLFDDHLDDDGDPISEAEGLDNAKPGKIPPSD